MKEDWQTTSDSERSFKDHRVVIDSRARATITAVEDIDSFNENEVIFLTAAGMMTVSGSDLHISRLSLDEGLLVIDGTIESLDYADLEELRSGKKGVIGRFLK